MSAPTVLLTGATGFIGGAALARLRETRPDARLLLLARDRGPVSAAERVRRSLARFVGPEEAEAGLRACEVLAADLTDPAGLADPRLDAVTHFLHLASNTDFRSVRPVRHTNILGTLALAHRMRRTANLARFVYVSTAYHYRFMEIDAEVFDNTRLLAEGMPAPPRFTDYLGLCATRPANRTVYQQILDDV